MGGEGGGCEDEGGIGRGGDEGWEERGEGVRTWDEGEGEMETTDIDEEGHVWVAHDLFSASLTLKTQTERHHVAGSTYSLLPSGVPYLEFYCAAINCQRF